MNEKVLKIQEEIDHIKEYLSTDFCKKCEEMMERLKYCEQLISDLQQDTTY